MPNIGKDLWEILSQRDLQVKEGDSSLKNTNWK